MKAEIMTVTPEMAKEFLKGNILNRTVSDSVVTQYASDMKANRWSVTGSGISIAKDGRLLDGQHRLFAIIKADVPVELLVCSEIENNVATFDVGKKRTLRDQYKLKLGRNDNLLTSSTGCAFINSCYDVDMLSKRQFASIIAKAKPSFDEINDYVEKNLDDLRLFYQHTGGNTAGNSGVCCGLRRANIYSIARAVVKSDKNTFTFADYVHFCTVLKTGCIVEPFDAPFIGLRDVLMTLKGGGAGVNHEIRLRVCYAIKQYLDKSSSRVNKMVESDKFSLADFI